MALRERKEWLHFGKELTETGKIEWKSAPGKPNPGAQSIPSEDSTERRGKARKPQCKVVDPMATFDPCGR